MTVLRRRYLIRSTLAGVSKEEVAELSRLHAPHLREPPKIDTIRGAQLWITSTLASRNRGPSHAKRNSGKRVSPAHFIRYPNAFFVFRTHWRHMVVANDIREAVVSQVVGYTWHSIVMEESKMRYREIARLLTAGEAEQAKFKAKRANK